MAALPGGEWSSLPVAFSGRELGSVRHVFTHFTLDLTLEHLSDPPGEGWWQPLDQLGQAGLPTLYRRAAELALVPDAEARAAA